MTTLARLEEALINAHNSGDTEAARMLAAEIRRVRESPASSIPDTQITSPAKSPTFAEKAVGAGEAALSLGTGAVGGAIGLVGGALGGLAGAIKSGQYGTQEGVRNVAEQAALGAQKLTYEPRTQAGQDAMNPIATLMQNILPAVALNPQMAALSQAVAAARPAVSVSAQSAMANAAQRLQQAKTSMAPIGRSVRDSLLGPPDSVAVNKNLSAAETMGASQRLATAEDLPIPINLTRGEAYRDAPSLAFEKAEVKMERGGKLRERAEESNRKLSQNFDVLADQTGALTPDVVSAGRPVVDALLKGQKEAQTKTNVAYAKWRKSEEANSPVDTNTPVLIEGFESPISFVEYLNKAPSKVATSSVTDAAKQYAINLGIAQGDEAFIVGNKVPAKALEDFRKQISGLAKWDDKSAIRDETILKKLIDAQLDPVAGPLLTEARKARHQQAIKFENRAVVARLINNRKGMDDPLVAVDKVFDRTVLNGSPEELTFLKRVLNTTGKDGKQAWTELQGATVRYLQQEATKGVGMDSNNQPIVSAAKLNQAVQMLDKNGRLDVILGKEKAQKVRDINDVARWVNTAPFGTLINTSGTALALQSALLETAANGVLFGLPAPVIGGLRALRNKITDNKIRAKIDRALNPKEN